MGRSLIRSKNTTTNVLEEVVEIKVDKSKTFLDGKIKKMNTIKKKPSNNKLNHEFKIVNLKIKM